MKMVVRTKSREGTASITRRTVGTFTNESLAKVWVHYAQASFKDSLLLLIVLFELSPVN